jgi:hypothetical protein
LEFSFLISNTDKPVELDENASKQIGIKIGYDFCYTAFAKFHGPAIGLIVCQTGAGQTGACKAQENLVTIPGKIDEAGRQPAVQTRHERRKGVIIQFLLLTERP